MPAGAVTRGSGVLRKSDDTKRKLLQCVEIISRREGRTNLMLTRLPRCLGRRSLQRHQQQRQKGVAKTGAQTAQPRCRRPDAQATLRIVGRKVSGGSPEAFKALALPRIRALVNAAVR